MYTEDLITVMTSKFNLFKQPHKNGDVLTINGEAKVIIGIQRFHYDAMQKCLSIRYFIQALNKPYTFRKVSQHANDLHQGWFTYTLKKLNEWQFQSEVKPIQLNDLVWFERLGAAAKVVEITSIEFIGTDLKVWTMVQPMYPIAPIKAKELYKKERMKGFELIQMDSNG